MARKLYGYLDGDTGQATKASSQHISAKVQTVAGRITVELSANGAWEVYYQPLSSLTPSGLPVSIARGTLAELEAQRAAQEVAEQEARAARQAQQAPSGYVGEVWSGWSNAQLVYSSDPQPTEEEALDRACEKLRTLQWVDGGMVYQPGEYVTRTRPA